jgi:hypothetical protein
MIREPARRSQKREVVKGYEYSRGQFLTFTGEELKALDVESSSQRRAAQTAAIGPSPCRGGGGMRIAIGMPITGHRAAVS